MKHIFQKTHNKMVVLFVGFDAGARAESDKYSPGLAHMLEHMMFKGTEKRSYLDLPREIAFLGGSVNAFTSHEKVAYFIKVPYENFEAGAEILSDMIFNSTFPEEEFVKEKEVVFEECLSYKDQVAYDLGVSFDHEFFSGRLQTDVIGTEESIKGFTREELVSFYSEFYSTESGILAISGDLDEEHVRSVSEKYFGKETAFIKKDMLEEMSYKPAKEVTLLKPDIEQSYVYIAYPGLKTGDSKAVVFSVLREVLGSGMDSRLFTEVREKNNLCYGIGMSALSHLEIGATIITSSTRAENIEKMKELIDIEIDKIRTEKVSEEELQRAKNKLRSNLYSVYDSGDSLARDTLNRTFFGLPSLEKISEELDKVTQQEVLDLAKSLFLDEHKMVFVLKSEDVDEN